VPNNNQNRVTPFIFTKIMSYRELTKQDAEEALRLNIQCGWNHVVADWERAIELCLCVGYFDGDEEGKLLGTATVTDFWLVGWIGMFLLDETLRGKGIGTRLFAELLGRARAKGMERFALDSSDVGRPIYRKFGFEEDEGIERVLAMVRRNIRMYSPFEGPEILTGRQVFAAAIRGEAELLAPAVEGIHSVELANAMMLSSIRGGAVELPLDAAQYADELKKKIDSSTHVKKTVDAAGPADDFAQSF
jgi:GNAT superfamily N-acetyltransferase